MIKSGLSYFMFLIISNHRLILFEMLIKKSIYKCKNKATDSW